MKYIAHCPKSGRRPKEYLCYIKGVCTGLAEGVGELLYYDLSLLSLHYF